MGGQVFPLYWLGPGVRSALLPGTGSGRDGHSRLHLATAGVLAAWAVAGLVLAPILLRRSAYDEGQGVSEVVYNRIAMLRAERDIFRRQLGVHYQTVGYLELGECSPSLYRALRIAEYFEIPVEVIFSTTPFPRLGSSKDSASA